jgi:hypothetical protein
MSATTAPQTTVDEYLAELCARLRSLPAEQVEDIVEEIRSHLRDSAGAGGAITEASLAAALQRLGPASILASTYLAESLLARAQRSRSPWLLLKVCFRWAGLSIQGFLVFCGALIGYGLAAAFSFCAIAKPLNPQRVGLWKVEDDNFSLHLGLSHSLPLPAGQEVLGWWITPLGLIVAAGLVLLTTEIGLRTIRRFQRARMTTLP